MARLGLVAGAAVSAWALAGCAGAPAPGFDGENAGAGAQVQRAAAASDPALDAEPSSAAQAAAAPSGNAGALSLTYVGTGAGGVYLTCDYGHGAFTPANKIGALTATAGGPAVTARPPAGGRIDWLDCGATSPELNLARNLDIVAGVPGTHSIMLAGGPTRTLNVLL